MEQADKERMQREIEEMANARFPGAVDQVVVLQYGDEPVVEPGQLMIRVLVKPEEPDGRERPLRDFADAYRTELEEFRREMSERFPQAKRLQFTRDESSGERKRVIMMPLDRDRGSGTREGGREGEPAAGELTPVMARLGPADLETVEMLITAGIAANRADAVRWALARIRERPAYAQLRDRISEIDRLKTEF
jgi:hypothetical protein